MRTESDHSCMDETATVVNDRWLCNCLENKGGKQFRDIGDSNAEQNEYWKRVGGRSPLRPPAEEDGNG